MLLSQSCNATHFDYGHLEGAVQSELLYGIAILKRIHKENLHRGVHFSKIAEFVSRNYIIFQVFQSIFQCFRIIL